MPPQTSPTGRQEITLAQRLIGRPSAVVPDSLHSPEQHSESVEQSSSWTRQPPKNWQRAPVPVVSRQTVEQQEPL